MEFSPYISLLTFFAGLLLGNKLAIGRDKRKEFNSLIIPLRNGLNTQLKNDGRGKSIAIDDEKLIGSYLFYFKRYGFYKAIREYKEASKDLYEEGHPPWDPVFDETKVNYYKSKIKQLLNYLKIK